MTYKVRLEIDFDNKPTNTDVIDYFYEKYWHLEEMLDCEVLHYKIVDTSEGGRTITVHYTYPHERDK